MEKIDMIKEKMVEMAKKIGCSPETIKAMESDMSSEKPSVTVAVVKKETPESDTKLTDEQIDKMSEQEAKDMLKKIMSEEKTEDMSEEEPKKEESTSDRIMNARTFM